MVTNLRTTLGITATPLVQVGQGSSPFAQAVCTAVTLPTSSVIKPSRIDVGQDTFEGWSIANQYGRMLVLPDRMGFPRSVFSKDITDKDVFTTDALPQSWLQLLWIDHTDLAYLKSRIVGGERVELPAYATVHEFGALKTFLPQMYDAFIRQPELVRAIIHEDVADLARHAFDVAIEVQESSEPRHIILSQGDAPLTSLKTLGDARISISCMQNHPRYGERPLSEDLYLVKTAPYLEKVLSWKRAFSVCQLDGEPALIFTAVHDKEKSSSHYMIRQGLRLMLGLADVDEALQFQRQYGYCEPGSDENEGGKLIVRIIDMCGAQMFISGRGSNLSPAAQMVKSAFRALAKPSLDIEVLFIERKPEAKVYYGFR